MNFDDLPKGIKEEIWNRLDKNEYNKMRLVSKGWKKNIENPKSKESTKKLKEMNELILKWKEGPKFYRGCSLSSKILKTNMLSGVGLECCYGKVYSIRLKK